MTHPLRALLVLALPFAFVACQLVDDEYDETLDPDVETATTTQAITAPNPMGVYCSTVRSDGGWFMAWGSSGDPCGWLAANFAPVGTIRHKGLYALDGLNNVILTCTTNASTSPPTQIREGWRLTGDAALQAAFNEASTHFPFKSCHITVSPQELPILTKPFADASPGEPNRVCNAFNYARDGAVPAMLPDGTMTTSNVVTNSGRRPLANGFDVGHDCGLPFGTPLHAMAAGTVIQAGCWDTDNPSKLTEDQQHQRDVIIEHVVTGPTPGYEERFYTLYAHLSAIEVSANSTVVQGQEIGLVGETGFASGPHLHFMVGRRSNTVDQLLETFVVPTPNSIVECSATNTNDTDPVAPPHNLDQMIIDPWGWSGQNQMDPWAIDDLPYNTPVQANPTTGGLSLNLWIPNQSPSVAHDWAFTDGTYEVSTKVAGKCMDVTNGSTADNAPIQQWGCNSTPAQRWIFKKVGVIANNQSVYEIRNAGSNKCLHVTSGSTGDGARMIQVACNVPTGSPAQTFAIAMNNTTGVFELKPQTVPAQPKCVDVSNSSTADGAAIQQWGCNGTLAQKFFYRRLD